jgi:hypothetical protein
MPPSGGVTGGDDDKGGSTAPPPVWAQATESFSVWRRKVQVWKLGTASKPAKMAAMVIGRLTGRAQELALEMEDGQIAAEDGLQQLLALLESKFGETEIQRVFTSFKELIGMKWTAAASVEDYLASFELTYARSASGGTGVKLSSSVQSMLLIHGAQLSNSEEIMLLANVQEPLDYNQVRTMMTKMFRDKKRGTTKSALVTDWQTEGAAEEWSGFEVNGEYFVPEGDEDYYDDADAAEGAQVPDAMWIKGKKFVRFGAKGKGKGKGKGKKGKFGKFGKGDPNREKMKPEDATCYACNQKGHFARDCPNKPKEAHVVFQVGSPLA